MAYKYATQNMTENMAKAVITSAAVSTKQSVEIAKFIKGKSTKDAIAYLEDVVKVKKAIPYTRFNWNVGHKPNIGPGRFPTKAASTFITLLKLAVANAADKNLDSEHLRVFNVVVQKAAKKYRYGRIRGQKAKHTHIELVVEPFTPKEKSAKKKVAKKAAPKAESAPKAVEAKPEIKAEPKAVVKEEKPVEKKVEEKSESKESAPKVEAKKEEVNAPTKGAQEKAEEKK